jgi:hypothetical protein
MDEHREEREELEAIARDDADDAREQEAERIYWQDVGLEHAELVMRETARWSRC